MITGEAREPAKGNSRTHILSLLSLLKAALHQELSCWTQSGPKMHEGNSCWRKSERSVQKGRVLYGTVAERAQHRNIE